MTSSKLKLHWELGLRAPPVGAGMRGGVLAVPSCYQGAGCSPPPETSCSFLWCIAWFFQLWCLGDQRAFVISAQSLLLAELPMQLSAEGGLRLLLAKLWQLFISSSSWDSKVLIFNFPFFLLNAEWFWMVISCYFWPESGCFMQKQTFQPHVGSSTTCYWWGNHEHSERKMSWRTSSSCPKAVTKSPASPVLQNWGPEDALFLQVCSSPAVAFGSWLPEPWCWLLTETRAPKAGCISHPKLCWPVLLLWGSHWAWPKSVPSPAK